MPARTLLSSEQRTRLFAIPTDSAEMTRHYVLDADDRPRTNQAPRGQSAGLHCSSFLASLSGPVLDPPELPPAPMIAFVARQIGIDPAPFGEYARRAETRREHVLEFQKLLASSEFPSRRLAGVSSRRQGAACATDRGEPIVQDGSDHCE